MKYIWNNSFYDLLLKICLPFRGKDLITILHLSFLIFVKFLNLKLLKAGTNKPGRIAENDNLCKRSFEWVTRLSEMPCSASVPDTLYFLWNKRDLRSAAIIRLPYLLYLFFFFFFFFNNLVFFFFFFFSFLEIKQFYFISIELRRTRIRCALVNEMELTWIEFPERGYKQMILFT